MSAKDKRRTGTEYLMKRGCRISGPRNQLQRQIAQQLGIPKSSDLDQFLKMGDGRWWVVATYSTVAMGELMMSWTLLEYQDGTPVEWAPDQTLVLRTARPARDPRRPEPRPEPRMPRARALASVPATRRTVELMPVGTWYRLVPPQGLTHVVMTGAKRTILAWLVELGGNHVGVDPSYEDLAREVAQRTKKAWTAWMVGMLVLEMAWDQLLGVYTLTDGHQLVWLTVSGCHEYFRGEELDITYTERTDTRATVDESAA